MSDTHTLIVWEEVPDNVKFILIPNAHLTLSDHELFKLASGKYINADDMTDEQDFAINCISYGLTTEDYVDDIPPEIPEFYRGGLVQYIVHQRENGKSHPVIEGKTITYVYCCGFYL